jgi:uncharacterized protein with FMN-binding domain
MAADGGKKLSHGLAALSAAAILTVYTAGFLRTKAAAARLDAADQGRRPMSPAPDEAGRTIVEAPIEPPAGFAPPPTPVSAPVVTVPAAAPVQSTVAALPRAEVDTAAQTAATPQVAAATQAPIADTTPAAAPAVPASTPPVSDAPTVATPPLPLMPKEHYKDGVYTGWGTSRHGDIQASVTIEGGRIVAAAIAQCRTRYSCSWVAHLPAQIVARQSPDCDYVSGATQSANAFYWAVVDALTKAKQA